MFKGKALFNSIPFKLFITLVIAFLFAHKMSYPMKQFFYAISLSLKEILMFVIPFIIFSSVYQAFSKMAGKAIFFVFILLACIVLSNFFSVSIAGIFSYFFVFDGAGNALNQTIQNGDALLPMWELGIPRLIQNNVMLCLAFLLAFVPFPSAKKYLEKSAQWMSQGVHLFLTRFFIPLLPFFIFGFVIKLLSDNTVGYLVAFNPKAILFMFLLLVCYLFVLYFAAVGLSQGKGHAMRIAKNIMAPGIAAFTTMSSAAALPFSLKAAADNTGNKEVADAVMPVTANVHMIGDSLCIPIMAMILLAAFQMPMPSLEMYLIFALSFVVTKFSGAGVPGGSILVMLPVLEKTLGFTSEMTALITIFYVLIDPLTTLGNVLGNNLFVIHFNKLYTRFLNLRIFSKTKQPIEL